MSNALAISSVTATLQFALNYVFSSAGLGTVTVSAVSPDIVQDNLSSSGAESALQVNLFLHQVTPNAALRNRALPSLAADGITRLKNPPLALDLHYLLTVYAGDDCQAEALLGYALQLLHENPVLTRAQISGSLSNLATLPSTIPTPLSGMLSTSGLADQIEMMTITPATLGREEMAWLWTALKADYRPTVPFSVSVVLIQSQNPLLSGLPVLTRNVTAYPNLGPFLPTISAVQPPSSQPAAALGDTVTVQGTQLTNTANLLVSSARLGISNVAIVPSPTPSAGSCQFILPNPYSTPPTTPPAIPTDLPVGIYLLTAQVQQGADVLTTNGLPLMIAPAITAGFAPAAIAAATTVNLVVPCRPYLRPTQQVSLLIGGQETPADAFTAPTNQPSFTFSIAQPSSVPLPIRLRVDGIDSAIIAMNQPTPTFIGPMLTVT